MATRMELQTLLEEILRSDHVYYQPPESIKMSYPAIVYSRYDIDNQNANNHPYVLTNAYEITVIDKDPDSEVVPKIAALSGCQFDRNYKADNLNHDVFTLYF